MFEGLSDRFQGVVRRMQGLHKLSEDNVAEALREARLALLEADVNVAVVKDFIAEAKEQALGAATIAGVHPGQQMIKIVHDKMVDILGGDTAKLALAERGPTVILMTGLQGSGKTTTTVKLARLLQKQGRRPLLVSADVYRPAAIAQLKTLGGQADVPVMDTHAGMDPVDIAKKALDALSAAGANTLLVDTAGRLHIDGEMMAELRAMRDALNPDEILFVADSMTGQDAVTTAKAFQDQVGMTGVVLTKLDGDTRGGAALSIKKITGAPVKFVGVGEKIDQIEPFHPQRVAGRILGMGDVLTLVEKAQENIDQKQAQAQAVKMLNADFNLGDFLEQLRMIKSMGPLDQLMKMIPGLGAQLKSADLDPDELTRVEAIISSMTLKERAQPGIINTSRKRRIARGSGMDVVEVNRMLKNFQKTRKMMKNFGKLAKGARGQNPLAGLGLGH
ncbi:MAG: signal recognition particle protein [Nitrospinae bacterium]|nr:signal recognition particle protein [Nitrospinota bacterium]